MSTDMETRLRAAFLASADVITDEAPEPLRATEPPRRPTWWPLLAAAAVVLAVAALAFVVRGNGGGKHQMPPVHRGPTPVLHPQACTVPQPARWHEALGVNQLHGLRVLGVTTDGAVLAARADRPQVVLVRRDGSQTPLYAAPRSVPDGDVRVGSASADGDWTVISLIAGGGQGALDGIVAVNVTSLAVRTVRSLLLGTLPIVQEPVVLDGVVYWSEGLSVGPDHVYAYDLATRQRRTLDHSPTLDISGPVELGGGVYWTKGNRVVTYRAGKLPPGFTVLTGKSYGGLVTSGDRQAWVQQVGQRFTVKMRIGNGDPVTMLDPLADPVRVTGIAGPYLLVGTDVLDTRTGATTRLTTPAYQAFTNVGGNGSTIAVSFTLGSGPSVTSMLSILDIAKLPGLHC